MAEQIVTASLTTPGFLGLNTQDAVTDLSSGYALKAENCVIDKYGRIGIRKGWTPLNSPYGTGGSPTLLGSAKFGAADTLWGQALFGQALYSAGDLGDNDVEFIFELVKEDNNVLISAGNNGIFTGTTSLSSGVIKNADNTGNAVYTISGNNWQAVSLPYNEGVNASAHAYLFQKAHKPLVYHILPAPGGDPHDHDSSPSVYGFQVINDFNLLPTGHTANSFKPNCGLAAFGRIWCADIEGDQQTVYFSRLLNGSDFNGGDAGYLSLNAVFPNNDRVVALAAHNGFLIIFGRNNIAIYNNPEDVTLLSLQDMITNVGCLARDCVQSIGTDILFLSDTGLRSLARVIQEKSSPLRELSNNVRDDFVADILSETSTNIKTIYYDKEAFFLVSLPSTDKVYCFDTRSTLQNGALKATIWNQITPKCFCVTADKKLLLGKAGFIGEYSGYLDNNTSYTLKYYTNYFDMGNPYNLKILKNLDFTVVGQASRSFNVKWGFDYKNSYTTARQTLKGKNVSVFQSSSYAGTNKALFGSAKFGNTVVLDKYKLNASGNGNNIQIGVESDSNGNAFSVQKLSVFAKLGKVA